MNTTPEPSSPWDQKVSTNKILIKGIITGLLILVMIIPTVYISDLIHERQGRQEEISAEVSGRWAGSQTLTGPYISLPYNVLSKDKDGKSVETEAHLWLLADNLDVKGSIANEVRTRSIYKVLLYRAAVKHQGQFIMNLPADIDPTTVQWNNARICYGLSDFKGIEERIAVTFNGVEYELSPGLPYGDIAAKGLSAPIALSMNENGKSLAFNMNLKLKGSSELHFIPMAGNSAYHLTSAWKSPSFDGNNLPSERTVNDSGFSASWVFNKANLPFATLLKNFEMNTSGLAFGVTILQPADQYAKTTRCVKYAILFIGLTFSLFFIIEILQKKPVHPVQYALIGMALVIFYTLLLSISEFIMFNYAYLIAALATILLITLYARGHFQSWKSANIFGGVLVALYGFIFILIQLEDTALLVGSIGLFVILALVMYASRKIKWYGTPAATPQLQ